ncbi:unnamed protein product, partial [Rotaria sp. Silwood2]
QNAKTSSFIQPLSVQQYAERAGPPSIHWLLTCFAAYTVSGGKTSPLALTAMIIVVNDFPVPPFSSYLIFVSDGTNTNSPEL